MLSGKAMLERLAPSTFIANRPLCLGVVLERDVGSIICYGETWMAYLEFDRTYPYYAKHSPSVANARGHIFPPRAAQSGCSGAHLWYCRWHLSSYLLRPRAVHHNSGLFKCLVDEPRSPSSRYVIIKCLRATDDRINLTKTPVWNTSDSRIKKLVHVPRLHPTAAEMNQIAS